MAQLNKSNANILRAAINGAYKDVQTDMRGIDVEINGIMRHLGIEQEKRRGLVVEYSNEGKTTKPFSVSHWRENRIRSTWPPDEVGDEALPDDEDWKDPDDHVPAELQVVEEALVDLNFGDNKEDPPWPSNWQNLIDESDNNSLRDIIPPEWLSQGEQKSEGGTNLGGLQIEPELLQQFRSTEAELLLIDL